MAKMLVLTLCFFFLKVASVLIFADKRRLIEVIPKTLIEFLNEWEIRVQIIVSLTLQILLITLGNRRKYIFKIWIRITLWFAYLLADWVAIVSLGLISKNTLDECPKGETNSNHLMWFWAQFFLLHLGGPDTITAYSLEDNELWLRHLVRLVVQTVLAFYILAVALPGPDYWLNISSMLVFIPGLIKYGERLLALSAANSENFRDSMLTEPDAGPDYAKFMEEFTLKKAEGYYVKADEVEEVPVPDQLYDLPIDDKRLIHQAYELFLTFKCLFAEAILSFQHLDSSRRYFRELNPERAFAVVEVELGLVFDELYTKAPVVYNMRGFVFRMVTFSFTLFAFLIFTFLCEKSKFKKLDLIITYLLLGVAICLEIYASWVWINSDWARNWMNGREKEKTLSSRIVGFFQRPDEKKRWSHKMAQQNLLEHCIVDEKDTVCVRIQKCLRRVTKLIRIHNYLEKHWYKTFVDVTPKLKELIFEELDSYHTRINSHKALWDRRGSLALDKYKSVRLDWNQEAEFDRRVLLWHIATDVCYSLENWGESQENVEIPELSKNISDYMLYLLIACPYMLPIGIGTIRFRDTCAEAKGFFKERNVGSCKVKACEKLLEVNTEIEPAKVKGDRSKSVLFDACRLAKSLRKVEKGVRWEMISRFWIEVLAFAAAHCGGNHHARQLRKGGELLSHVWLLMAHLGITEQFQINQGHKRAKLVVK
ncbi:hypothetical protein PHJA_000418700 [Phtheirospermum japonicum]|uniref:DUF4220 domain-containing protein n=1 Tax=Phtheirospermum japonicum TaxID=374723 RepID=A0A830B6X3_9LAMI|nr:hypothetical protein PHJA_000418700 [Phtheirospermum japonicum]